MRFFKTKKEKQIIAQMERDEQMDIFNNHIDALKSKREKYARIASEAESIHDVSAYNNAVSNLIELNEIITSLLHAKADFDIINVSNDVSTHMEMAMNALSNMAPGDNRMPNFRKVKKTNFKVAKYMKQIKLSNKVMSNLIKLY